MSQEVHEVAHRLERGVPMGASGGDKDDWLPRGDDAGAVDARDAD
jgi:hypothetical protein